MGNTRLLLFAFLILCGLVPARAFAQDGIYVMFTGSSLGNSNAPNQYGPTVGLYVDRTYGKVISAGVDMRASFLSGDNRTSVNTGLVGFRAAIRPQALPISPYGELMIGISNNSLGYKAQNNFTSEVALGVDYTVIPHVDWRVVEWSYARVNAPTHFNPNSFSTGVVLRFR
ncbi:MAG TPA: outer membrane beta-barrel protein [Acidobacteriaceae bacterium]